MTKTSSELKQAYDKQYQDPAIIAWRHEGAAKKAKNIIELTESFQPKKVLEVGSGEGSILYWLDQAHFSEMLYAIDISQSGIQQVRAKNIPSLKEAIIFDGYQIPYPDDFFDLVYCSHVIEHVEFPRQLIREIKRVSKHQFFEVPIDFSFYVDKKIDHFLAYGHINIFTPGLFRFLLQSEGLTPINDKCGFFDREMRAKLFKGKPKKHFIFNIKTFILSAIPYLRGIKPNFYCVLTE